MRGSLVSACLLTICAGVAIAQSTVAYVYVAEDRPSATATSPISVYAATSTGKLAQISGSPFKQTSGTMSGTNGSHFITVDQNFTTTHQYLHVYNVASNGVIGSQVSKYDLHNWCEMDQGAEFDHTGQYVYVLDAQSCGEKYQSFSLSKSGYLTFKGSLALPNGGPYYQKLPVFSGNDKFAYTQISNDASDTPCPTTSLIGMGRESSVRTGTDWLQRDGSDPAGGVHHVANGIADQRSDKSPGECGGVPRWTLRGVGYSAAAGELHDRDQWQSGLDEHMGQDAVAGCVRSRARYEAESGRQHSGGCHCDGRAVLPFQWCR